MNLPLNTVDMPINVLRLNRLSDYFLFNVSLGIDEFKTPQYQPKKPRKTIVSRGFMCKL